MQVTIDIVPVEAHWSIGLVERYHQPLRRAYEIIKSEAAYNLSIAAQVSQEPTDDQIKALSNQIRWQIDKAACGLRFIPLTHETLRLVTYTDASHANNKDLSSQIG
jgi:hypothetical protein